MFTSRSPFSWPRGIKCLKLKLELGPQCFPLCEDKDLTIE